MRPPATIHGTATTSESGTRFRAVFTNAAGSATSDAAVLTVLPAYAFSIGSTAVIEGDTGGNRSASLSVVLSKPASQATTIHYATAPSTATAGTDFVAKSGTLTFKAGQTLKFVTVPVKPDTQVESDEILHVVLSAPTGGPGLHPDHTSGTVTILNDDGAAGLRVGVGDATMVEGDAGNPNVVHVLVSLSAKATSTVSVTIRLQGGQPRAAWITSRLPRTC